MVFRNQTKLKFKLYCKDQNGNSMNLTGVTSAKIKYIKPGGASGNWTATIETGAISYIISLDPIVIDTIGIWRVWGHLTYNDGSTAPGTITEFEVAEEGMA